MEIALALTQDGAHLQVLGADAPSQSVSRDDLPELVRHWEAHTPRWIVSDTSIVAPVLLRAGVRVQRCHDLRLCHAILNRARPAAETSVWDSPAPAVADNAGTLLADLYQATPSCEELIAERERQLNATEGDGRLRLLMAAESVGALIAAEMRHDGLPWDTAAHDQILTAALGPRPPAGTRPEKLETLATRIRAALDEPALNPDSPADLLRAMRAHGLDLRTTGKWEIQRLTHPVVEPLLEYKHLARLLSANGWVWLDAWVEPATAAGGRGRFRPDYVPGGVVTGRWATSGGGALQLPKQIRAAVSADPEWRLVVADAAQIEPRVLAAMSGDEALAVAGRGGDLYQGLVDAGVVPTRDDAKVGMLGALYGGTTGNSGLALPRLQRAYPRAIGVVEEAARTGERGGTVRTWLGRTSPPPSAAWLAEQRRAGQVDADAGAERSARQQSREWGRFTRNFVVQGTAAEWALCWMGEIRRRLREATDGAHLVFFLHDEVIVHAREPDALDAAQIVAEAAEAAGTLMFGETGVNFPLSVRIAENYAEAG